MKKNKTTEKALSQYSMIDVGRKRPTRRYAVATGTIYLGRKSFAGLKEKTLPKGDALPMAEIAGVMAAKNTANVLPMCHPLPLEQVVLSSRFDNKSRSLQVFAEVLAFAKTGVEMEALNAVQAALLTVWDLAKGTDADLEIGGVRLLAKTGGKTGVWVHPEGVPEWVKSRLPPEAPLKGKTAAVMVMSDRASAKIYRDETGPVIEDMLAEAGAEVCCRALVPDDPHTIAEKIKSICAERRPRLLIAAGGTGPGPRDSTPEVLAEVCERMLEGLGEFLRAQSLYYTDTAWLSRMTAGMCGATLVVAFPGSPKAVRECWDMIAPFIGDAIDKIEKQGHRTAGRKGIK